MNKLSNTIGQAFVMVFGESASFLDSDNILWKMVEDNWIGKRSVWTKDYRAVWIEETEKENIEKYWCGKESNYSEVFTRD